MREMGIAIPPQKLKKEQDTVQRDRDADGGCFIHSSGIRPFDGIVAYSQIYRPPPTGKDPVQLTMFCDLCGGQGCGDSSVRVDENHYCVQGMKLHREQTWVMKHMTLVSGKPTCAQNFLPKLLMLHKELNLDIAHAEVRQYQAP